MKKPKFNIPGLPFNFDAFPLWIEPHLWDVTKIVLWRRTKLVLLYAISMSLGMGLLLSPFFLIFCFRYGFTLKAGMVFLILWVFIGVLGGVLTGLGVLRDFTNALGQSKSL